jgi:formylglycine-generating enzyme required for sulfatase activity
VIKRFAASLIALLPGSLASAQGCPSADLNRDGTVSGGDLSVLLGQWGGDGGLTGADLNGSGLVTGADLAMVLEQWGQACPPITTPPWASIIEAYPDPAIVTSTAMRSAITATRRPWRIRDMATQIEMLLIPPGTFQMGCSRSLAYDCFSNEFPLRQVTLTNAFYMARLETTKPQWRTVMGQDATGGWICQPPSFCANWPVTDVTWSEVQAFLVRSGMRLPTEAEWEWACRAGTTTAFHGWPGNSVGTNSEEHVDQIAFRQELGYGGSVPGDGGQRSPNGFGLHDMCGNVSEWVGDWYGPYWSSALIDPSGPTAGSSRVVRGGFSSYYSSWPNMLRSSARSWSASSSEWIGFRVARNP